MTSAPTELEMLVREFTTQRDMLMDLDNEYSVLMEKRSTQSKAVNIAGSKMINELNKLSEARGREFKEEEETKKE
jgi:hypothetical protein